MKRIFLIANFYLLLATCLYAEDGGVQIRPTGVSLVESEPRKIVTAAFRIVNKTSTRQEFISSVELPEGWILTTRDFPFELGPDEGDIRLVNFFVPQAALTGKYEVTYLVNAREYPSISDFWTIYVVVLPVTKLEVKLAEAPEYVICGEDYQASFLVLNQSNTETSVSIRIDSGENLPYTVDAEEFQLSPGESKQVTVTVKTDSKIRKVLKHHLQLTAQNHKVKATATSLVDIIPGITGVEERFHKIPAAITFKQVSQRNKEEKSGFQGKISGGGRLDEQGKRHIEFCFRGPDIQDKSPLGQRDEYFLSYWTEDYELHSGDRSCSLSPLTEENRYGRGIEGRLNLNNFGLGVWHQKTRWAVPEGKWTAGYIDYSFHNKYRIGLNYLRKKSDGKGGEIVSFEGQLEPTKNTDIELEYALGEEDGKDDNACLLEVSGYQNWISYYLRLIHAGPDYPGYCSDMDFVSASLGFPLRDNLRLRAGFQQGSNNLDLDPALYSALQNKYYQLGLDYRLKIGTSLSLDWRNQNREDRLPNPRFNYQEETFRLGIGQSFKKSTLYASAETGKKEDKLDDKTSRLEKYSVSAYFRPTEKQSYGGYLYYDVDSDFGGGKRRLMTAGLNGSFQITAKTFLNLDFQTNDYQKSCYGNRASFEMKLSHVSFGNHRISVYARHTSYTDSNERGETAFMAEYTIPFGLPVGRKKDIGIIKGYVYDEESKQALSNGILRLNGATAVTDKNGKFTFPSLKPGTYYLNVDKARIGLNRITVPKTPMEVNVEDGKETWVEVALTRAALLSGKILVYRLENGNNNHLLGEKNGNNNANNYHVVGEGNNNNSSLNNGEVKLAKAHGLANMLVEITNGSERKRRLTDRKGHFKFEELRPGKWSLKIYDDNLPEYHYLKKDTFEFELKPGEKEEVLVKVLPKKRRIRIIEEGVTLLEEEREN